jgi:carboxypeptidase D
MEVGPWRTDGKGGFQVQEGGWEEYTTMVFGSSPPSVSSNVEPKLSNWNSRPACRHGFLLHEYRSLCAPHGRGTCTLVSCVHPFRSPRVLQAQKQFLEFLRQFYDVFPEYKRMDVRVDTLRNGFNLLTLVDLFCWREFRWTVDTILWFVCRGRF